MAIPGHYRLEIDEFRGWSLPNKTDSPCVSVCQFDARTGWCSGCGCTLVEIREWRKLTPFRRTALGADLKRRLRALATDDRAGHHGLRGKAARRSAR